MNKTVWLIRHGESAANAGLATISPDSIPLTERGFRQAESIAENFPVSPSLIVVSPYLRAKQTSEPSIRRFVSAQVQDWVVQEFTYLNAIRCGQSTSAERKPLVDEYWNRSSVDYCDGNGAESFGDFISRARNTLEDFKNSVHETIAVFSHGQFIRAMMWLVLTDRKEINSNSMREFQHFLIAVPFQNTAMVKITFIEMETFLSPIIIEHLPTQLISH